MIINDTIFNVDLDTIISELKIQLANNGIELLGKTKNTVGDIMVSCPYHSGGQEKRPSAGIRKSDGQFHCFACGETHTLQEVVSHCFGHYDDMIGAFGWNWLVKNFVSVEVETRKPIELNIGRQKPQAIKREYVSEEELDSYRYIHPYMYKRGLTDPVIELFDIGYDKATQCITFPIRDVNGNTLFIARRSVNYKYFNYPTGAEKPLYGLFEYTRIREQLSGYQIVVGKRSGKTKLIDDLNSVIICESMLDALKCWTFGRFAFALNGTGSELQFKQLNALQCRKLILATDNDSAGQKARLKIRKNVKNKIITEFEIPKGKKDINELTLEEFLNMKEVFNGKQETVRKTDFERIRINPDSGEE